MCMSRKTRLSKGWQACSVLKMHHGRCVPKTSDFSGSNYIQQLAKMILDLKHCQLPFLMSKGSRSCRSSRGIVKSTLCLWVSYTSRLEHTYSNAYKHRQCFNTSLMHYRTSTVELQDWKHHLQMHTPSSSKEHRESPKREFRCIQLSTSDDKNHYQYH